MELLTDLLDLVLPRSCAGCAVPGRLLCRGCTSELGPPRAHRPDPAPPGLPPLLVGAAYAGAARGALLAHKERGRLGLVRPLGGALAAAVAALDPPPGVLLVPVPSSPQAVRERGHDHALRLAAAAARRLPGTRARPLLALRRSVADQAGLGAAARAANLSGALVARRPLAGRVVVVVDDVVTTGATLVEATRALRAAGAQVHGAAAVAATARRSPPGASGAAAPPGRTPPLSLGPLPG